MDEELYQVQASLLVPSQRLAAFQLIFPALLLILTNCVICECIPPINDGPVAFARLDSVFVS